jgi:hypothetical protein
MSEERAAADEFVAFWDALVLDQPTDDFAVDEDLAAALRRFQDIGSAQPTAARERVWAELQPALVNFSPKGHPPTVARRQRWTDRLVAPDSGSEETPRTGRQWRHWVLVQFATAALLLVTLGLGVFALGPGRPNSDRFTGLPVSIPAPEAPAPIVATPKAEPNLETLFATTFAADRVPSGGDLRVVLRRLSLPPGSETPVTPEGQSCCSGPQITYVLEGELTVEANGPMQVFRSADLRLGPVQAPPGEEVVVRPGDTVVHDFAFPAAYINHGASPVQIINGGLYAGTVPSPFLRHTSSLAGSAKTLQGPLPAGPITINLIRTVLPPDGAIPAPPPGSLVVETGATTDGSIDRRQDGSLLNVGDTTETIYAFVLEFSGELTPMP